MTWSTGREDPRVPESFVERLTRFDPLLRIRWGWTDQMFHVERRVTRGRCVDPGKYKGPHSREKFLADRDGYLRCFRVHPSVPLDGRVIAHLAANDMWRGGADRLVDEIEAEEAKAEAASLKEDSAQRADAATEMYNHLGYRWKNTCGMALTDPDPTKRDRVGVRSVTVYGSHGRQSGLTACD